MLARVQAHDVLGDLAALHGGHRRQRQLPGQVARRVDVRHVRLAVVVDRHVAAVVDLDAGGVEARGPRSSASSRWPSRACVPRGRAAVVAARPSTPPSVARRCPTARAPLSSRTPRLQEVVLERGRHLGVLLRQHLLAADDERDLRAERREHVDELHAGDAGADHDEVLGQLGRRVGVAGGEHAVAVDGWPSRGCGAGCRCDSSDGVGVAAPRAPSAVSTTTSCGPVKAAGALDHAHALALEQAGDRRAAAAPRCASIAAPAGRRSRASASTSVEAHALRAGG